MNFRQSVLMMLIMGSLAISAGQPASNAIVTNLDTAKWTHEKGDPPGSESMMLRDDPKTGGMELLVRFPAGHVIAPHWHEANERIIVLEGQLTLRRDNGEISLSIPVASPFSRHVRCGGCPVVRRRAALSIFPGMASPLRTERNRIPDGRTVQEGVREPAQSHAEGESATIARIVCDNAIP